MAKKQLFNNNQNSGFFQDLILQGKLILRLIADKRVNIFLKAIPIGALLYVILPIDLIPEIALPVIGYLDDAAIMWMGVSLFLALCPEEVVQEHTAALHKVVPGTWRDAPAQDAGIEVIDLKADDPIKDEK